MEKRNLNVSFYKAGNGTGTKITLPKPWLSKMGITKEEREVVLEFDEEKEVIILKKK